MSDQDVEQAVIVREGKVRPKSAWRLSSCALQGRISLGVMDIVIDAGSQSCTLQDNFQNTWYSGYHRYSSLSSSSAGLAAFPIILTLQVLHMVTDQSTRPQSGSLNRFNRQVRPQNQCQRSQQIR